MTPTEQLLQDLRNAIRAECIAELRTWRATLDDDNEHYNDGVDDAILTLERNG